jgi:hypothetical protein
LKLSTEALAGDVGELNQLDWIFLQKAEGEKERSTTNDLTTRTGMSMMIIELLKGLYGELFFTFRSRIPHRLFPSLKIT